MKYCGIFLILYAQGILCCSAQNIFQGILLTENDSTALPYAVIKLTATGEMQITDEFGVFTLTTTKDISILELEIAVLNYHGVIQYERTHSVPENIYIPVGSIFLNNVEINGYSAEQVIQKAVEQIPFLYPDSAYVANGFYRQIHKENKKFVRLIEVQSNVLFNMSNIRNKLTSEETVSIQSMRRSFNYEENGGTHLNHFFEVLHEDPVYHLAGNFLHPNAMYLYTFTFDTAATNGTYIIHFRSTRADPEKIITGTITIDEFHFAIMDIEIFTIEKPHTLYKNNFTIDKRFTVEHVDGYFHFTYAPINDVWYLQKIQKEYTHDYIRTQIYEKAYVVTESFEWYFDALPDNTYALTGFSDIGNLYLCNYIYDPDKWNDPLPPYKFFKQEDVYHDLSTEWPVTYQFEYAGK
ncbi:MAG: hypothetical protein H7Y00_10250 [Fimbriimonadaceae bacterium]|nr:hypothetical protein [Chitinophagales bacterium]